MKISVHELRVLLERVERTHIQSDHHRVALLERGPAVPYSSNGPLDRIVEIKYLDFKKEWAPNAQGWEWTVELPL